MFRYSLIFLLFGISVNAEAKGPRTKAAQPPQAVQPAQPAMVAESPPQKNQRTASRHGLLFDYNSWFENIRVLGGTPYDTKALLYGLGLSYEYTLLHVTWGWGWGGGFIHGYAVSGDSSDTTSYYAKRVPLEVGRINTRIFSRVSPRFDFGFLMTALYTISNYPVSNGLSVEKSSSMMLGAFLDTRWRLDGHWELIQALGTFNRGPSLAWRLGTVYSF